MKMLLRIAAQTFNLYYTLYAISVCGGITENQCRFWNFDCRSLNFQRHTLYFSAKHLASLCVHVSAS